MANSSRCSSAIFCDHVAWYVTGAAGVLVSAEVVSSLKAMAIMIEARCASARQDRLEFDPGDAGCEIEAGLPLHADRLQRIGIARTAEQKVAAEAYAE